MRILIVDDDLVSRRILWKLLENDGHWVVLASDGAKAISILEDNPSIELVISDLLMPNLCGYDVVEYVTNSQIARQVIVISGKVGMRSIGDIMERGAFAFLPKPVDMNALRAHLASAQRSIDSVRGVVNVS